MKALTVSQLTTYINKVLKMDHLLQGVLLEAEISQAKQYPSGHLYLTLKDEESQIQGIMYKWSVKKLDFEPKHGMKVEVQGQVQCYEAAGRLQINITSMSIAGQGALHLEFLKRKEILEKEGLFDVERKKEIPKYLKKIGLVTSIKAAALTDFLQISARRNPNVEILISPSSVQGEGAPGDLIRALDLLDQRRDLDLIVITRGGGSLEDLWAFNDENLVRKIASLKHPVVSAVGHEIDFSLTDFVADLRASTPSAAAEMLIQDKNDLIQGLDHLLDNLKSVFDFQCIHSKKDLNHLKDKICSFVQDEKFLYERVSLERSMDGISFILRQRIKDEKKRLEFNKNDLSPNYIQLNARQIRLEITNRVREMKNICLDSLNKESIYLEESLYSLKTNSEKFSRHKVFDNNLKELISVKDLKIDDRFGIDFYDGRVYGRVVEIIEREASNEL